MTWVDGHWRRQAQVRAWSKWWAIKSHLEILHPLQADHLDLVHQMQQLEDRNGRLVTEIQQLQDVMAPSGDSTGLSGTQRLEEAICLQLADASRQW